jgi:type IV secretory pathway TrbD component
VCFLLAQLVLLGSLLVILFIIFSSSPWLLEAVSLWMVAIMLIVLLLEEACLFLFVVKQHCEKHFVHNRSNNSR